MLTLHGSDSVEGPWHAVGKNNYTRKFHEMIARTLLTPDSLLPNHLLISCLIKVIGKL